MSMSESNEEVNFFVFLFWVEREEQGEEKTEGFIEYLMLCQQESLCNKEEALFQKAFLIQCKVHTITRLYNLNTFNSKFI